MAPEARDEYHPPASYQTFICSRSLGRRSSVHRASVGRCSPRIPLGLAVVLGALILALPSSGALTPTPISGETQTPTLTPGSWRNGAPILPSFTSSYVPHEWANLTSFESTAPSPRGNYGIAYDEHDGYTVLFGGQSSNGVFNDTWIFRNGTWSNITRTAGTAPLPRFDVSMAYDAADAEVVLFGGASVGFGGIVVYNDTWAFQNGRWSLVAVSGPAPSARYEAGMAYSGVDRKIVMFGGYNGSYLNDTWAYSGGSWASLTVVGHTAPAPRRAPAVTYDAANGSVVLFGGVDSSATGFNDTWRFANDTWSLLTTPIAPSPRWVAYMAYDPTIRGSLLFGGCDTLGCATTLDDTWELANGTWTDLSNLTTQPPTRGANPLVYEPVGLSGPDDLFMGGSSPGGALNDTWVFSTAIYTRLAANPARLDVGQRLSLTAKVAGGVAPFSFQYGGLPSGCSSQNQSSLSCLPNSTGSFDSWVNVSDSVSSQTGAGVAGFMIYPALRVRLEVPRLRLEVGQNLTVSANATGGDPPYHYLYSGLPHGCPSVDQPVLTCAPSTSGNFSISVRLSDLLYSNWSTAVSVKIDSRLQATATIFPAVGDVGRPFWMNASALAGNPPWTFNWSGLPTNCSSAVGPSVTCAPDSVGVYSPTVAVRDADGAIANVSAGTLSVNQDPNVTFSPRTIVAVAGGSELLQATVAGGTSPFQYSWSFGDGTFFNGSLASVSHVYTRVGNYTVRLIAIDAVGAQTHADGTATIVRPLSLGLSSSAPKVTVNTPVDFFGSIAGGEPPFTVIWSGLPSGCRPSPNTTFQCTPNRAGTYSIRLMLTDTLGDNPSAAVGLSVVPLAVVELNDTASSACAPLNVNFTGVVASGGTAPFRYSWTFGDGARAGGSTVAHAYSRAGIFQVNLTVLDASNATVGASTNLTVESPAACASSPAVSPVVLGVAVGGAAAVAVGVTVAALRRRRRPPTDPPAEEYPPENPTSEYS